MSAYNVGIQAVGSRTAAGAAAGNKAAPKGQGFDFYLKNGSQSGTVNKDTGSSARAEKPSYENPPKAAPPEDGTKPELEKPDAVPETTEVEQEKENPVTKDKKPAAAGKEDQPAVEEVTVGAVEEVMAQLNDYLKVLQDILGISAQKLQQWMDDNGFTAQDMLQPENVKSLVVGLNGLSDTSKLLTDAEAFKQFTDALAAAEQFWTGKDGEVTAEDKEAIRKIMQQMEAAPAKPDGQEEISVKTGTVRAADTAVSVQEDRIPVTVTAETEAVRNVGQDMGADEGAGKHGSREKAEAGPKPTAADAILNGITQGLARTEGFQENLSAVRQMQNIVNQVVEEIKVTIKQDATTMELQLNPENLGKVNLSVSSKDGVMTAHMLVQNQVSKEAMESQIQVLRETLENQGVKVEAIEVTVSDFGFRKGEDTNGGDRQQKGKNRRSLHMDDLKDGLDGLTEEETLDAEVMIANGNQVDLTA